MRSQSILYALLKPFVNWACRLFYRNLHVRDSNKVCQTDSPIILISNHQNALLDPLLCCITSPRQLNFLTRSDVFKNPVARKLLMGMNMLPVYRPHDGVNILESNAPTFRESLNRLENNQIISLFPEGTHQKDQNLKPFKKGAARLIGNLLEAGNCDKVIVQPVGLHFTNIMHSGYPGFVQFGEELVVKASDVDLQPEHRSKMVLELIGRLREALLKCVVHIEEGELYQKKLFVFRALQWRVLFSKSKSSIYEFKELEAQLDTHTEKLAEISEESLTQIENSAFDMPALVLAADDALRKKFSKKLLALIPIYLLGFISSFVPYVLGKLLSKRLVKDIHFTSTAKIVSGFIIIPLFWGVMLALLMTYVQIWLGAVIGITLIFCGAIFLKYHTSYRILSRANGMRQNSSYSNLVSAIREIIC